MKKRSLYFILLLIIILLFSDITSKKNQINGSSHTSSASQVANSSFNVVENDLNSLQSIPEHDTSSTYNQASKIFFSFNTALFSFKEEKNDDFFSIFYDAAKKEYAITYTDNEPTDYINVYAADYFSSDSTTYNLINSNHIIYKYNGSHSALPEKVKYINYTLDTSHQPKQEWIEEFKKFVFAKIGQFNSPIIVKESWSVQYGDAEIDVVNFCNIVPNSFSPLYSNDFYTLKELENIPSENSILFNEYVIFCNNDIKPYLINNAATFYYKIERISSKSLDDTNFVSFKLPEEPDKDKFYNIATWTYQYDNKHNIIKSPVFGPSYYFQLDEIENEFCFLDLDNDGNLEIIKHREGTGMNNILSIYSYNATTDTINYIVSF